MLTGKSSLDAYAVMGRDEWPVFYTRSIDRLIDVWGNKVEETSRFIDLELRQTDDPTVYFDVRMKEDGALCFARPGVLGVLRRGQTRARSRSAGKGFHSEGTQTVTIGGKSWCATHF